MHLCPSLAAGGSQLPLRADWRRRDACRVRERKSGAIGSPTSLLSRPLLLTTISPLPATAAPCVGNAARRRRSRRRQWPLQAAQRRCALLA